MVHALTMQGKNRHPLLYALATLGGRLDLPVYLNLRDIMMLLARKPSLDRAAHRTDSGNRGARHEARTT